VLDRLKQRSKRSRDLTLPNKTPTRRKTNKSSKPNNRAKKASDSHRKNGKTDPKQPEKSNITYLDLTKLRASTVSDLRALAEEYDVSDYTRLNKEELVFALLRAQAEVQGLRFSEGVLEILPDGYGFLRDKTLLPGKNDIYVSPSQIKRFGLRDGDIITGQIRPPKEEEKYFALLKVEAVNFEDPEAPLRDEAHVG